MVGRYEHPRSKLVMLRSGYEALPSQLMRFDWMMAAEFSYEIPLNGLEQS